MANNNPSQAPAQANMDAHADRDARHERPAASLPVTDAASTDLAKIEDADTQRAVRALVHTHGTFAESYPGGIVGALALPAERTSDTAACRLGFLLSRGALTLIDVGSPYTALDEAVSAAAAAGSGGRALHELIRHPLRHDLDRLIAIENDLARIEAAIVEGCRDAHGSARILRIRRDLMRLDGFYQQVEALASDTAQDECGHLSHSERRLFATLAQQMERLEAKAGFLREYCMQLLELRQAQTAERRESTNLYLTVMASIFVPITTITGWYGMNFTNMPELSWEYGYTTVIALSLVVIALELVFFKWKRWL